jgi:serine-type D-Ala-D-Ala carboxypeptidase (penicillin-binding protein 5/6)
VNFKKPLAATLIAAQMLAPLTAMVSQAASAQPAAAPAAENVAVVLAPPFINAPSYLAVEATSGQVIAEVNAKARRDPASLTKLMTAFIVFDALYQKQINLGQRLRMPERAWKTDGARLNLRPKTLCAEC